MNQEQREIISNLRSLADFLESRELDLEEHKTYFSNPDIYLFCDGQGFLKNVKKLGGFERNFSDYAAQVIKKFGSIKFILHTSRELVCEKVKVGVEVRPATPERIIPAQEERIVDKFEYRCPESLLNKEEAVGQA